MVGIKAFSDQVSNVVCPNQIPLKIFSRASFSILIHKFCPIIEENFDNIDLSIFCLISLKSTTLKKITSSIEVRSSLGAADEVVGDPLFSSSCSTVISLEL